MRSTMIPLGSSHQCNDSTCTHVLKHVMTHRPAFLSFFTPSRQTRSDPLLHIIRPLPRPHPTVPRRSALAVVRSAESQTLSPMPPSSFRQKYGPWALITGASSGIGAEFASQLAARYQISLVLVARRQKRLSQLADTLRQTCHVQTRIIPADLTTSQGIQAIIQQCSDIEIGLLINNAGEELHGSFFKPSAEQLHHMISLNVTAVTHLAHAFGRPMVHRRRGGIIFVSSISASGMPWLATYASTKSYVTCLALSLRDELMRSGVDCMSLEPGLVASEMTLGQGENSDNDYHGNLMPTDYCVSEALRVFGAKPVFTPGFKNRLIKNLLLMLPRSTALWLLSEYFIRVMDPEDLQC